MGKNVRLNAFQVRGEALLHLRLMALLPPSEHFSRVGFMLAVHHCMMIAAKQEKVVRRVQFILRKAWFSPWAIGADCIDVTYVSSNERVGVLGSRLNECICACWMCTLIPAQCEQDLQCLLSVVTLQRRAFRSIPEVPSKQWVGE